MPYSLLCQHNTIWCVTMTHIAWGSKLIPYYLYIYVCVYTYICTYYSSFGNSLKSDYLPSLVINSRISKRNFVTKYGWLANHDINPTVATPSPIYWHRLHEIRACVGTIRKKPKKINFQFDEITHACLKFKGGLPKLLLESGHAYIFTFHSLSGNGYPRPNFNAGLFFQNMNHKWN